MTAISISAVATSSTCAAAANCPSRSGHEIEGEVIAIGEDVEGVTIGQHRVAFPWIGCGQCPTCKRGDEHLCNKPVNLGIQVAGGYATHVIVPHPRYLIDYNRRAAGPRRDLYVLWPHRPTAR